MWKVWIYLSFVSEIQDIFSQLAQFSVNQVLLDKTRQKYGLWLASSSSTTFLLNIEFVCSGVSAVLLLSVISPVFVTQYRRLKTCACDVSLWIVCMGMFRLSSVLVKLRCVNRLIRVEFRLFVWIVCSLYVSMTTCNRHCHHYECDVILVRALATAVNFRSNDEALEVTYQHHKKCVLMQRLMTYQNLFFVMWFI